MLINTGASQKLLFAMVVFGKCRCGLWFLQLIVSQIVGKNLEYVCQKVQINDLQEFFCIQSETQNYIRTCMRAGIDRANSSWQKVTTCINRQDRRTVFLAIKLSR